MRVAVYIEKFSERFPDKNGSFLIRLLSRTAQLYPGWEFIFITSRTSGIKFTDQKNVMMVRAAPITNIPLLRKAWLDIKLPAILKKYGADIFIGDGVCSLRTKIPQCLLLTDHSQLIQHEPIKTKFPAYYKKVLPGFFKKAKSVICFSNFVKKEIVNKYGKDLYDLHVIPPVIEEIIAPLNETDKNKIKQEVTDGFEYFIYMGELHAGKSLTDMLRAFSIFKKMQQSNMKLVLAGKITSTYKKLIGNLRTYKYRDAVILKNIASHQELVNLSAAAYALILPPNDDLGLQLLQAMRSGAPVVSVSNPVACEIAGDSVFYFNAEEYSDLAAQMMRLYKDEDIRKDLIEKAKKLTMNYNMDHSAKLLGQAIEEGLK
jgi:glycosyltransferase involved in cell wall biosynthesis